MVPAAIVPPLSRFTVKPVAVLFVTQHVAFMDGVTATWYAAGSPPGKVTATTCGDAPPATAIPTAWPTTNSWLFAPLGAAVWVLICRRRL